MHFSSLSVVIDSHLTRVINATCGPYGITYLEKEGATKMLGHHLFSNQLNVLFSSFVHSSKLHKVVWMVAYSRSPKQLANTKEKAAFNLHIYDFEDLFSVTSSLTLSLPFFSSSIK